MRRKHEEKQDAFVRRKEADRFYSFFFFLVCQNSNRMKLY